MTIIPIDNDAHWREIRLKHVGGSDIAALFGESSYLTTFELWHFKRGTIADSSEDTERSFWGKNLEAGIAHGLAKKNGWEIEAPGGYYKHPSIKGMGCTPDYFILSLKGYKGRGVLQIKNVDYIEYRDNWLDEEPPLNYLLQLQHEIACTGCKWGVIGVLIAGNEGKEFIYLRHEQTIKRIEGAVVAFWRTVEAGEEPKAVADDYETVRRIFRKNTDTQIDLSRDNEMPMLCAGAIEARVRRLDAQHDEDGFKAEIIRKMAGAERATCNGFFVEYPEHAQAMQATEKHDRTYRKLNIRENTI